MPPQFNLNNSAEQHMYFMLLEALPVFLKATSLIPSVFPTGSRQQKGNAITQMCILTMPNHSSIYYTNMGMRRIAPGMFVWAACTMNASWDITVYHCYSGLVLCVQHMLHLFHMCEFRSTGSAPVIWIPWWFNNMTLAWHILFIQLATLWLFPKITSDMPHPQSQNLLWTHIHIHEHVNTFSFTCCLFSTEIEQHE